MVTHYYHVFSGFENFSFLVPNTHTHPLFSLDLYLFGVCRGLQRAAVVLGVHHGHVGAAVVQHLLDAVDAAALATGADGGAGDGVVAAQTVHLAAWCLAVLLGPQMFRNTRMHTHTMSDIAKPR